MKLKEMAFLALMAALSVDAAWFTRFVNTTALPRKGDFIHFNVDTTAGKRMAASLWFTKAVVDSLKYDDLVAQGERFPQVGGGVMREEANKDNALMPHGPSCIFQRRESGYSSPGDTSWEISAFSAETSPSIHADYFIRGARGRASQFGRGTTPSLPLILESKPMGHRDTTRDAWIHSVEEPFETQLPGTHDKTATAFGYWIVIKDQKGTFFSDRSGYEKVPFTRYRVEMRIDSVLNWEKNVDGVLIGRKVSQADPVYQHFRARYARQQLFYYNIDKGIFMKLEEFVDEAYLKWDVYMYFLGNDAPISTGSIQVEPKGQQLGLSKRDALGRRLTMMNSFLYAGVLQ